MSHINVNNNLNAQEQAYAQLDEISRMRLDLAAHTAQGLPGLPNWVWDPGLGITRVMGTDGTFEPLH